MTYRVLHVYVWPVQYALDYYPPFASGCGFVLSRDLVQALLAQPLPDYRLLVGDSVVHACFILMLYHSAFGAKSHTLLGSMVV